MTANRRLAIGRLWHEANAFSPVPTGLDRFLLREWQCGPQSRHGYLGTATEMGAVVAFLDRSPDWDGTFLRCTSAPPGGPVEQAGLNAIIDEIVSGLTDGTWDGVYISLHGAISGTQDLGPDYTLLRRVRETIGPDVPLAVTFDMHACLDPRIGDCADIMVGYKTYPHVDMAETAAKALALLDRMSRGQERFRSLVLPVPMLPPSHSMRTADEPMRSLVGLAAEAESAQGLCDITVFGGFAYADTPWTSSSVSVCYSDKSEDDRSRALVTAQQLAGEMKRRHHEFIPTLPDAKQGLEQACRLLEQGQRWPVAVLENADNPLSGGAGDTPGLFRAVVEMNPSVPVLFASFCDPDLVAKAHAAGVGATLDTALGGRLSDAFGAPVPFKSVVVKLTDGRFVNTGPMECGRLESIGRTAMLRNGAIRVVIAETAQSVNDPAWCSLHDIDLAAVGLFCTKAKNHFRAGFGDLCGAIIDVDTPGPAPADLTLLPYRHVPTAFLRAS